MNPTTRPSTVTRLISILILFVVSFVPFANTRAAQAGFHSNVTLAEGSLASARFSIFGKDDRVQITDTTRFPYSAIVLIRIYSTAEDLVGKSCTGWMIGPSTLATAAHCIYNDGYPHHIIVKPGMNSDADNQTPFGACDVTRGIVPDEWIQTRNIEFDYGVYHLNCTVGNQTGWFRFKTTTGDWTGGTIQLAGYPNDKMGRTMWSATGSVTSTTANGIYYNIDMWPGQSGSPVWVTDDKTCPYCVVAINSSQFEAPTMNFGARINTQAYDFLSSEIDG